MPSFIISNSSGGDLVYSGGLLAGNNRPFPQDIVQLRAGRSNSGNAYISLSGGMTINSGQMIGSGGVCSGLLDGMQLGPGDAYSIPRGAMLMSGIINIYAMGDQAVSGLGRIYVEVFSWMIAVVGGSWLMEAIPNLFS